MNNKKIIPITRVSKFFSEADYKLQIAYGREFIESFSNFTVILYRVDRQTTQYDDIYGESTKDGIRFLTPIELKVLPYLETAENKSYNKDASLRYQQDGKFSFYLYQSQLDELAIEITFGDYIGYPVTETEIRYFSVSNNSDKYYDNAHSIMGYKGAIREIFCVPVDETEFRGV